MLWGWLLGKQTLGGTGKHGEVTDKEMGELGGGNWEVLVVLRGYWDSLGDTGGAEEVIGLFGSCGKEFWRNRALRWAGRDWKVWGDTGRGQMGDTGGAEGRLGDVKSCGKGCWGNRTLRGTGKHRRDWEEVSGNSGM